MARIGIDLALALHRGRAPEKRMQHVAEQQPAQAAKASGAATSRVRSGGAPPSVKAQKAP